MPPASRHFASERSHWMTPREKRTAPEMSFSALFPPANSPVICRSTTLPVPVVSWCRAMCNQMGRLIRIDNLVLAPTTIDLCISRARLERHGSDWRRAMPSLKKLSTPRQCPSGIVRFSTDSHRLLREICVTALFYTFTINSFFSPAALSAIVWATEAIELVWSLAHVSVSSG